MSDVKTGVKTIQEIEKILPHRAPMLLIETAELVDGVSVCTYTVRGDEYFLQGHFPNNPVVPGVIQCEMMAQASCLLVDKNDGKKYTPYFTGMNNVRFKKIVVPGDTITLKSEMQKARDPFYFVKCTATVDGKVCATGELSFMCQENPKEA